MSLDQEVIDPIYKSKSRGVDAYSNYLIELIFYSIVGHLEREGKE